jgi:threonine/homoserine/homoserine lactone efflux protein
MGHYWSFAAFALILAIAPGPDTFLVLRASVVGGRDRGLWTVIGITVANLAQGMVVAAGLGAIIVHAQTVFTVIRIVGVLYLGWLGIGAIRAALSADAAGWGTAEATRSTRLAAMRQGGLSNVTNPKVIAFNLAVLPQFAGNDASFWTFALYVITLTVFGVAVQLGIVLAAESAGRWLQRDRVRRGVEGATGVVFLGFATVLAIGDGG